MTIRHAAFTLCAAILALSLVETPAAAQSGPNAAGYWTGIRTYNGPIPGSLEVSLVQISPGAVAGFVFLQDTAEPSYYALMTATGAINGNTLQFVDTAFVANISPPGYVWCLRTGTLTFSADGNSMSGTMIGTGNCGNEATYSLTRSNISNIPLGFVTVTPCRIADTRQTAGPFGGPSIPAGGSRSFAIPSSSCGIPASAQAYSLNVTAVPRGTLGYLTVWPTGLPQPYVSTLNSLDGRIKANAVTLPSGSGSISVFATDQTDVVLDITGYFGPAPDPSAMAFYPLTPCRIADTRNSNGPLGGPIMAGGTSRMFPIRSATGCNIPSTAKAYSLNFTVVPESSLGYLTTWPTGQTQPYVSTLNAPTGTITANAAVVPSGTGGNINVFVTDTTHVIIDINGYYAPAGTGGLSLYNMTPCRVLDTRQQAGAFAGAINVNVSGSPCSPPSTAGAYVFNATVVPPGPLEYLSLWPQGLVQPWVSSLNAVDGSITSNMAVVPADNGSISAYASSQTQLILDIFGYFGQ